MYKDLFWVGIKESEIRCCKDMFKGSITFVGTGKDNNISYSSINKVIPNYNIDSTELDNFVISSIKQIKAYNPKAKFMFYSPGYAYALGNNIISDTICCNNYFLLNMLKNKMQCRLWVSGFLPTLKIFSITKNDCTYEYLESLFPDSSSFVIQGCSGAGGHDTFIVNEANVLDVKNKLSDTDIYIVSKYISDSYSINTHLLIGEKNIVMPPSVQIVEKYRDRMLYKGADFIEYRNLPQNIKEKVIKYTQTLAEHLNVAGYKGVCGVDYIIDGNDVLFLEINPRFQSSSSILNLALRENNLPTLQEMSLNCFQYDMAQLPSEKLQNLNVTYSNYIHSYDKEYNSDIDYYLRKATSSDEIHDIILDGYNIDHECEQDASIFNVISRTNIVSINENNELNLHQNIKEFNCRSYSIYKNNDLLELKIALLNRGISLTDGAAMKIKNYRQGVYSSLDIYLHPNFVVNCPVALKFTSMSPFSLDYSDETFILKYCNEMITKVKLDSSSHFEKNTTTSGVNYGKLSFLATDRLRIHHSPYCFFKRAQCGCEFCDVNGFGKNFNINDIKEVIDWHLSNSSFRHILIGGASGARETEFKQICEIIKYIKSHTTKPVYLMALPPADLNAIDSYYKSGLDEIAFNIEAFDRKYALKYMPGKGKIPIEHYKESLLKAVSLWGKEGKVKSSLIYGIEPDDSFFSGIEWLTNHGIQPIISIFRPLNNTKCAEFIPPNDNKLLEVYHKAVALTSKKTVSLGPDCIFCQNNTLSFAY